MAYTIVKTNGTILTTISDGTINTTVSPIGLPGRNYAGYGQQLDTNFVHTLENFANPTPPPNALTGQLWYNTTNNTMYVCPVDGETNPTNWLSLSTTSSGGTTSFGNVTVSGILQAGNIADLGFLTVSGTATIATLNVSGNTTTGNISVINNANIGNTLTVAKITTGSATTPGTATGTWTFAGGNTGNGLIVTGGNIFVANAGSAGIRCDYYYYSNGSPISFAGTYGNSNVATYLPTANVNILSTQVTTPILTTGSNTTAGTITGNWSLSTGSRLNATYADLAERFAADEVYAAGTVVSLGGEAEITSVKYELSEDVFGVISNTAAYLMNAGAGNDDTHPAVAVSGRVQVKVVGKIRKGDRLVSAGEGLARSAKSGEASSFNVIGRALTDKTNDDIGYVEAFVSIK
jgi:hypothetical protein